MEILTQTEKRNIFVKYVPHGIDGSVFKKISINPKNKRETLGGKDYKFILFWNNRNIKRKRPADVIYSFKKFLDMLPISDRSDVVLLMHTDPVDQNGTNLYEVSKRFGVSTNVLFSTTKVNQSELNFFYNISDVTINIASNEGFGLTTAESLMAGTPIIATVTGGLQDQLGLSKNGKEFTSDDYIKLGTLHSHEKYEGHLEFGEWCTPIWPTTSVMAGSIPTPYILDDIVDVVDVANAIKYWYDETSKSRSERGSLGSQWMRGKSGLSSENMNRTMSESIDSVINGFVPKKRHELIKITK